MSTMACAFVPGAVARPGLVSSRHSVARRPGAAAVRPRRVVTMVKREPDEITLSPSYNLQLGLLGGAVALKIAGLDAAAVPTGLIGAFLLYQVIKVNRDGTEKFIRSWDYIEFENWEFWFPKVPVLIYFKEVRSIHFFPVIFNPDQLLYCLQTRTGIPKVSYPKPDVDLRRKV